MYLLYLDESGSVHSDSDYFVVGGVALHEQDCWPLAQAVEDIAQRLPAPVQGAELHASPMSTGRPPWRRIGKMESYAEVPLFVDSKVSRLVQLADSIAYWTHPAYMHGDDSVLTQLVPALNGSEGSRLDGLVRLVKDYGSCNCVACRSRR